MLGDYYSPNSLVAENGSSSVDSICPLGWAVPVFSGNKSWDDLMDKESVGDNAEGSAKARESVIAITLHGFYGSAGSIYLNGTHGLFWEIGQNSIGKDNLNINSSNVNTQSPYNVTNGLSLRCVKR